jgi:GNAT superfamily N-acetyltransferase
MNPVSLGCFIVPFESIGGTAVQKLGRTADPYPLGMTIHRVVQVMNGTQSEITIREAAASESAIILHHRRSMFRDMGEGTVEELDRMVEVATPWLARALAVGSYRHWLALDDSGRVAGGGGVLLCSWPANPKDPCTERAVILNVYTECEFRKRGIARQIMLTILDRIKAQGLRAVNLHASTEGRHLYEQLGFEATNEMRLKFDRL